MCLWAAVSKVFDDDNDNEEEKKNHTEYQFLAKVL